MRYYLIAGERSGDLHGGNLIKALKVRDPQAEFRCFGGDNMKDAGAELVVHYEQMAFMGFAALITNYGTIRRMLKFCKEDVLKYKPDVVIHIDYGGFNRRIAKFARANKLRTFYYIPPKIWAWYQGRAREIKANVDRMFVILPFEKDFYKKYNWDVDYVGNPVLDAVKSFQPDPDFLNKYGLTKDKPIVALLPGSRRMELTRIVPLMAEVVKKFPEFQFAVAEVDGLDPLLYEPLRNIPEVKMVLSDTYNLLHLASASIVTSGTATLETGLFRVPQMCVYKSGWLEMKIARAVVKVKWISLINLIAGKEVICELIQEEITVQSVSAELRKLVSDDGYRNSILSEYQSIYSKLDTGSASDNTARLMIGYLKN